MTDFNQRVEFCPFDHTLLAKHLGLREPPFARGSDCFRQLNYMGRYLDGLKCSTVVIERRYIDRDYMEDHGVFYSRNFFPYPNECQRVHFFVVDKATVEGELRRLADFAGSSGVAGQSAYRDACAKFSEACYLGFSVIKPLHGCPVGRTVLRPYGEHAKDSRRLFPCTRVYSVHLLGIELSVPGLAFQQQDAGVSACATTALWSALHKIRDLEDLAAATPAQITTLASRYTLPFGRTMPAEGLSLDQMCQAIQAFGLSPNVFRTDKYEDARGILYSAAVSETAPILILTSLDKKSYHAVTLAGIKVRPAHAPGFLPGTKADPQAGDLLAAYVHDDRNGPYVRASLSPLKDGEPWITIGLGREPEPGVDEVWRLTHILIAMHSKIRLSFASLHKVALNVVKRVQAYSATVLSNGSPVVKFETEIVRSSDFVEGLLFAGRLDSGKLEDFYKTVPLPRYLGVVRISNDDLGTIEVLLDSTGTARNLHCLAILYDSPGEMSRSTTEFLAAEYDCVPEDGIARFMFLPVRKAV